MLVYRYLNCTEHFFEIFLSSSNHNLDMILEVFTANSIAMLLISVFVILLLLLVTMFFF